MTTDPWRRALATLLAAPRPPRPWRDGYKIPWDDPAFSERLLAVHLDPSTHLASRSGEVVGEHVTWLRELTSGHLPATERPVLLDLGCGPGLYCLPLARAGWRCVGVDFGPAAIAHARRAAERSGQDCTYLERDLTQLTPEALASYGPFDVVTFWFGEFNSFPPEQARGILELVGHVLQPGGILVLEYQPHESFVQEDTTEWQIHERSFWSERPHLWLQEHAWSEADAAEITVHWLLDLQSGELGRHAQCHQAYERHELDDLLWQGGCEVIEEYPPITGCDPQLEFPVLVARRRG